MDDKQKESYQVERTGFHDSAWYRLFDVLLNSEKSINKLEEEKHDKGKQETDRTISTPKRTRVSKRGDI